MRRFTSLVVTLIADSLHARATTPAVGDRTPAPHELTMRKLVVSAALALVAAFAVLSAAAPSSSPSAAGEPGADATRFLYVANVAGDAISSTASWSARTTAGTSGCVTSPMPSRMMRACGCSAVNARTRRARSDRSSRPPRGRARATGRASARSRGSRPRSPRARARHAPPRSGDAPARGPRPTRARRRRARRARKEDAAWAIR